jgi:hypothetical protein
MFPSKLLEKQERLILGVEVSNEVVLEVLKGCLFRKEEISR